MLLKKKLLGLLSLMLVLAGCGGGSADKAPPRSPDGFAGPQTAVAQKAEESSGGFFGGGSPAQPAPPAPAAESRSGPRDAPSSASPAPREPSADLRPGLGTERGETRSSRVHDVTFVRDSSRPFAIAQLHYHDRRGAEALASVGPRRDVTRALDAGGGAVTVSIRDASGNPLEAIHAGGKTIVIGSAGQRYSIVLETHTSHRFEAVATVDGLDVINGKAGTFENRGYILMPFATLEIDGFRQSSSAVAAFRFGAVGDSYAAQMGTARNVGVIGVAFFGERGDAFVPENEARLRDTASPFPADPRFAQPPRR
jgi:hypothetical protein